MIFNLDGWCKVVYNFIKKGQADVSASFLESFKLEIVSHPVDAAVVPGVIVSLDKPNCPTLYFFYSIYISFEVGVPNGCSVF